jgi:hypothetical protein
VACMGKQIRIKCLENLGKSPLVSSKRRWDDIKIDLTELSSRCELD